MFMVPASNFQGISRHVDSSRWTSRIISPPPRKGSIASRSSGFAYSPPDAVGPSILWPLIVRKSQSRTRTSTGACGTSCAPSTRTSAPIACASSAMRRSGGMVPSTFDMPLMATSRVFGPSSRSNSSRSRRPSPVTGTYRSTAPVSRATSCHGMMFEWCSSSESTISSPSRRNFRPQPWATRLIDSIVFNRGTTESINLVAHGWGRKFLREGDEIVLSELEHHSNIIPWQLVARDTGAVLRYVPVTGEGRLDLDEFDRLLGPNTRLVAISGMSNVLGTMPPLRRIADDAHAIGALVLVDGAQLVPHAPVDVRVLDCDFLTISGHKMLGPTASGGLYAKPELLEAMDPFLGGGEMIREVHRDESTWREIPWKFEAGTMNIAEEIGLAAAIDYLEPIGMEAVRAHEEDVAQYAIDRLVEIGARVFGQHDMTERGAEISFWFRDIHPHDLSQVLDQEGVAIRAGHHCTQILHRVLGVPATARASFYLYNTRQEVDSLIAALERARTIFG